MVHFWEFHFGKHLEFAKTHLASDKLANGVGGANHHLSVCGEHKLSGQLSATPNLPRPRWQMRHMAAMFFRGNIQRFKYQPRFFLDFCSGPQDPRSKALDQGLAGNPLGCRGDPLVGFPSSQGGGGRFVILGSLPTPIPARGGGRNSQKCGTAENGVKQ